MPMKFATALAWLRENPGREVAGGRRLCWHNEALHHKEGDQLALPWYPAVVTNGICDADWEIVPEEKKAEPVEALKEDRLREAERVIDELLAMGDSMKCADALIAYRARWPKEPV